MFVFSISTLCTTTNCRWNFFTFEFSLGLYGDYPVHFNTHLLFIIRFYIPTSTINVILVKLPSLGPVQHLGVLFLQPGNYISHLIGHEGPGSILTALKARGWCNNLVAGNRPAPRGLGFFGISVDLTEEGINHTDEIIELIFQVI